MAERLIQIIKARWIIVSGILAVMIVENILHIAPWPMIISTYVILGLEYLFNGLWIFWVSRNKNLYLCQYLQVTADVVLIMAAIYLAGGIENTWGFVPAMIVFLAGVYLSYSIAIYLALLAFILFAGMAVGEIYGLVPHFSAYGFSESIWKKADYVLDYVIGMGVLYLAAAFISGHFGGRIRQSQSWLEKEVARLKAQLDKKLEETNAELFQRNKDLEVALGKLEQAQERLNSLSEAVDISIDGMLIVDLDGKILNVNESVVNKHGLSRKEEMIGRKAMDFVVAEDRQKVVEAMRKLINKGYLKGLEYRIIAEENKSLPVEANGVLMKDKNGKAAGIVVVVRDISASKLNEQELKKEVAEIEKLNRFMTGRETRIVELKKEVNRLMEELGRPAKYKA